MTFERLCELSEELAELKRQAREAAEESLLDWYPDWVRQGRGIRDLAERLAAVSSLDCQEVVKVVREGLTHTYQVARERQRHRPKAGRRGA